MTKAHRRQSTITLLHDSPLRPVDPRVKLVLSLGASLAVALPLRELIVFMAFYAGLLIWSKTLSIARRQIWRIRWILLILFGINFWLLGWQFGVLVALRLVLLMGSFSLFFATTSIGELRMTLEWLRVPYRYAFAVSLAFQSVSLLSQEWRTIREAQRARGVWAMESGGLRSLLTHLRDLVALTVPAIVLTTQRAWAINEAAYARGFESPQRRAYHRLSMRRADWAWLAGVSACILIFALRVSLVGG